MLLKILLSNGMNNPLCLEDSHGNLAKALLAFIEKRIQGQIGQTLFPNTKKMNFKTSVSPISDL